MNKRFTSIEGLSEIRRFPRLGKVRLGIKVKSKKSNNKCKHTAEESCKYCTYPKETPYFVVPPEVAKVYGDEPTELDILLPVNDREVVFPQAYEYYGSGKGLKCTGNGKEALRYDEDSKSMVPTACPCDLLDDGKCSKRGHLQFILPKVNIGGVYQIDTSSWNSIVDINSSLEYVKSIAKHFDLIPLKLKREPRETHHDGKKQTHHTLRIELQGDLDTVNALRANNSMGIGGEVELSPPTQENPQLDSGPVYSEEDVVVDTKTGEVIETESAAPEVSIIDEIITELGEAADMATLQKTWGERKETYKGATKAEQKKLTAAKDARKKAFLTDPLPHGCTKNSETCELSNWTDDGVICKGLDDKPCKF